MDAPFSDSHDPQLPFANGSRCRFTLVFITNGLELAQTCIRQNIQWMFDAEIPVEGIHIVGPRSTDIPVSETGHGQAANPDWSPDLPTCLSQIGKTTERIAIVGTMTILNESVAPFLMRRIRGDEILSWYQPSSGSIGFLTRLVAIIAQGIQRLILRTGKHELNCGGVILHRDSLEQLRAEGINCATIDQLIAGGQVIGSKVTETRIGIPGANGPQQTMRSALREFTRATRFWWQQLVFPHNDVSMALASLQTEQTTKTLGWRKSMLATSLLLVAAFAVLFTSLGYRLFEPDETRNAQLALNILESGDWLSLKLDGEHYWNKPPLQAWMTAASYLIFGQTESATRLPCALCSFLTLAVVLGLGGRLLGYRTGLIGAAMLLSCFGFVTISRYVTMDASLTLFATLMGLATLLGVRDDIVQPRWLLLAGIACGLGLLTKGPVILVLILPPVLLFGWLSGSTFWRKKSFWLWPGVPAFLIASPWFLATGIVHPDFLVHFFWKHNFVRFSDAFDHREPFWFYGPILVLVMYPACFLLPALVRSLVFCKRVERQQFGTMFSAVLLGGLWPLAFFSVADAKLPSYILPAVPFLCLLLGRLVDLSVFRSAGYGDQLNLQNVPGFLATSAAIMIGIVVFLATGVFHSVQTWMVVPLVIVLAATVPLLLLARSRIAGSGPSWTGAIAVAILFGGTGVTCLMPVMAEFKTIHGDVARTAHEKGSEEIPILYFGVPADGSSFTLEKSDEIVSIDNEDYLLATQFLIGHPKTILVTTRENAESLSKNLMGTLELTPEPGQKKLYSVRTLRPAEQTAQSPGPVYK